MSDSDDDDSLYDPQLRPATATAGGQKWSGGKMVPVVSLVDSSDNESQTVILVEPKPPSPSPAPAPAPECTLTVVSLADGNDADNESQSQSSESMVVKPPAPACTLEIVSLADGDEADPTCAGPAAAVDAPSAPLRVCDVFTSQSIRDELHHNGGPALIPQAQSDTEEVQFDTGEDSVPWENPLISNRVSSGEDSDSDFSVRRQKQGAEKKRRKEGEQKKKGKRSKFDNLD